MYDVSRIKQKRRFNKLWSNMWKQCWCFLKPIVKFSENNVSDSINRESIWKEKEKDFGARCITKNGEKYVRKEIEIFVFQFSIFWITNTNG